MFENNGDVSNIFTDIGEPKYIIKIRGKTFRYSKTSLSLDVDDNIHVELYCINGCCPKEIIITQNEINLSKFRNKKLLELVEESTGFDDHKCNVFNENGIFTKDFIEEVKIFNENPLNNSNLSHKEKLAYIETMDTDEELKQLFRESVNFVESM